jgi:hypothetical protein
MRKVVVMARTLLIGCVLLVLFAASYRSCGAPDELGGDPQQLNAAETKLVLELAESELKGREMLVGKVVLSKIDVFRDTHDPASPRKAMVVHYRYVDNAALLTGVDVARKKVLKVEVVAGFPTPLAPEETARAEKLARAHPKVKAFLDGHGGRIQVESYLAHSGVPSDPAFSHRVANIAFRLDGDYLRAPNVDVDLTDGVVLFPDRMPMLSK